MFSLIVILSITRIFGLILKKCYVIIGGTKSTLQYMTTIQIGLSVLDITCH
jgi:hypothetical protein